MTYDTVIRGGRVVDGTGGEPFVADVAIRDGKIAEVGIVSARGREEIDAQGKIVTPGFVDIHTHYDGQATWDGRMQPSSWHGVTTVVMGNCGVGFAPCREDDHDKLVRLMEGVEDIPFPVLTQGLPWNWQQLSRLSRCPGRRGRSTSTSAASCRTPPCASSSWVSVAPTANRRRRTTSRGCASWRRRRWRPARSGSAPRAPSITAPAKASRSRP